MNIQSIILGLVVALLIALALWQTIRKQRHGGGCASCNVDNCALRDLKTEKGKRQRKGCKHCR